MISHKKRIHIRCCMIGIFYFNGDARVKGYAKSLIKSGYTVDVLSLKGLNNNESVDDDGVRIFNIPGRQARGSRARYFFDYGLSFLLLSFTLTRLYFKYRYDIIHVHNMPDFLVFCGFIPKLLGAKIILDIHDPMPEVFMSKYPHHGHGLGLRLLHLEEKLSAMYADAVITANPHFKENLVRRGVTATKITTINNHPNSVTFNSSMRLINKDKGQNKYKLIFPGTIEPRYGLDVAIRALPQLKLEIQNIHLLIIGRQDDYAKSLMSLAIQLGVSSQVEFMQVIPNNEVPLQLIQADIGIYPALPDCHMSIATPGKLLEYAIMGLPIVSSRLKIVEEIFGESAVMYFEPGNVDQFAQCILRLHNDPTLRERLIQQADQMLSQQHSWEQEFQAYLHLLYNLLPEQGKALEFDEK